MLHRRAERADKEQTMGSYILALDQGTTSSRAIIFDKDQSILGAAQKEFAQIYPEEGWVEHDPMEIFSSQFAVMAEVIAKSNVPIEEIKAAMEGMLSPEIKEEVTATVEVREVFKITKVGTVAGCMVKEVATNYECGISLKNYQDIKIGDIIEGYEEKEVKKTL